MNKKTKAISFTVRGEDLTRLARNLWLEGSYEKAIHLLVDGLSDMNESIAVEICTGIKKLIGNEHGMDLEDENVPEEKLKTLAEALKDQAKQIQDQKDIIADMREMELGEVVYVTSHTGQRKIPKRRAVYIDSYWAPKQDWIDIPIWEQCKDYDDHQVESLDSIINKLPDFLELKQKIQSTKAKDEVDTDTGWLSPDGKFYSCLYMQHRSLADLLAGLENVPLEKQSVGGGERILEEKGWVKLCGPGFINGAHVSAGDKPITKAQQDKIFDWCALTGIEFPKDIMND